MALLSADSKTGITLQPQPSEPEIQFILDAIAEYLTVAVRTVQHCSGIAQLSASEAWLFPLLQQTEPCGSDVFGLGSI